MASNGLVASCDDISFLSVDTVLVVVLINDLLNNMII